MRLTYTTLTCESACTNRSRSTVRLRFSSDPVPMIRTFRGPEPFANIANLASLANFTGTYHATSIRNRLQIICWLYTNRLDF